MDRISRSTVGLFNDFLGSGNAHPAFLAVTDEIQTMGGIDFEHWVADLFKRAGFQVEVTQASGDHGVDLLASKAGVLIAVQCKRWDGSIGEPVVRDLYGSMISAKAQAGCIVTTGSFTTQAERFAAGKPVYLIAFDELMELAKSPEALAQKCECE